MKVLANTRCRVWRPPLFSVSTLKLISDLVNSSFIMSLESKLYIASTKGVIPVYRLLAICGNNNPQSLWITEIRREYWPVE